MDAAWACYEAWAWLQLGHGDIALVYGVGRGSLPADLDQVMPSSLDPYYLTPLYPHRHAIAGLQAAAAIEAGITTEREMADVVNQSLTDALSNPFASSQVLQEWKHCWSSRTSPHRCASTTRQRSATARRY